MEFHPSMGFVRLKRVLNGKPDPMLEASGMEEGDSVLDCTAGLGADALVFSGKGGRTAGSRPWKARCPCLRC